MKEFCIHNTIVRRYYLPVGYRDPEYMMHTYVTYVCRIRM